MTEPFTPDLSDESRCVSTHWSLPVQCVLPRSHRENWHEAWHPETGNRLRYRYTIRATEQLHHGDWHNVEVPAPRGAKPSRFHSTPAEVDAFLRDHFAEDVLLRYQQSIGWRAVEEAARDVRQDTNLRQLEGQHQMAAYGRELADLIDPMKTGGPYPSQLISLQPKAAGQ